ncbi:hypothetical protein ACK11Z_16295, partial [Methanoculleus bourgensis]|uniref:hypothetical protein n=1 Tax=Methanoculleus bourgensis TaxID=83986 RepID=UPI003B956FD8
DYIAPDVRIRRGDKISFYLHVSVKKGTSRCYVCVPVPIDFHEDLSDNSSAHNQIKLSVKPA